MILNNIHIGFLSLLNIYHAMSAELVQRINQKLDTINTRAGEIRNIGERNRESPSISDRN